MDNVLTYRLGGEYRHGAQGVLDEAPHSTLENEFGTHRDEDVVKQILERGVVQESEVCGPFFRL